MKWSWKIGTFAGIAVYMHATFVLLLGWIALTHWMQYQSLIPTLTGVAFILALFLCVVLHEYGHALAARSFGIETKDITLLPIGGLARLERIPDKPNQELWVALAGPAVNVVIAAALGVYLFLSGHFQPVQQMGLTHGAFLERVMFANLFLVGFNMIPAFPMDGGRVLRALLAKRMEYARATRIAASIGQGVAFLFGFLGLFTNPFLVFIAFFIWIGAAQEAAMVETKSVMGSVTAKDAMIPEFRTLSPRDELSQAVKFVLNGWQQDFPVVDQQRVVGMLLRADMIAALASGASHASVGKTMREDFPVASPSEPLQSVFTRLYESEAATVPIVENGRLVGLITLENMTEYMMIRAALSNATSGSNGRIERMSVEFRGPALPVEQRHRQP
ncbi:MAG TPA: site-2 protease family protein [Terriglobales bacterium]|nr:site-2 protease family protein [Terriglobales bacterium]